MTRYGAQFGPDITFLGVDPVDLDDAAALAAADVVIVGAPFDGGTSHRPGTRFGPQAIRQTDYLPHDGSRPHLALRVDALQDIKVVDAGDVEMPPGEIERALGTLEQAVYQVASAGAVPARPRWRPLDRAARRDRRRPAPRLRQGVDDPLRRARRHRGHRVRLALRPRPADAPADRVGRAARRPVPPDGAARLLARPRDVELDGRAEHALLRDDRDRQAWPGGLPGRGLRDRARRVRRGLPLRRHRRLRPRARARHRHPGAWRALLAAAPRRRTSDLPRAARRRDRRGRGVAALRPRRDHCVPRQPGLPRGAVRARRQEDRHHARPRRTASGGPQK